MLASRTGKGQSLGLGCWACPRISGRTLGRDGFSRKAEVSVDKDQGGNTSGSEQGHILLRQSQSSIEAGTHRGSSVQISGIIRGSEMDVRMT